MTVVLRYLPLIQIAELDDSASAAAAASLF